MGQSFAVVNLDKRKYRYIYKLGESLWDVVIGPLWCNIQFVPSEQIRLGRISKGDSTKPPKKHDQRQSLVTRLPPELFLMILEHADDIVITAVLGYTCRKFYDFARSTLQKQADALAWAGDRIAIFGEGARFDDLPSDEHFTPDEMKLIEECRARVAKAEARESSTADLVDGEDEVDADDVNSSSETDSQDAATSDGSTDSDDDVSGCYFWHRFIGQRCVDLEDWRYSPSNFGREFDSMLDRDYNIIRDTYQRYIDTTKDVFFASQIFRRLPWGTLLRNLTTKEYIRTDALTDAQVYSLCQWTLAGPLLLRVCWSSWDHASTPYDRNLTRGPWACHRFDFFPVPETDAEITDS